MPLNNVIRPKCFDTQLNNILKKFHKSNNSINNEIAGVGNHNPYPGDLIPGFYPDLIYKWRLPLKEYQIAARSGLRVIYLFHKESETIIMIAVYYKGDFRSESDTQKMIRRNLKTIIDQL